MSYNIDIIDRLLKRFKFKQPVPEDIQGSVLDFNKEALVETLKNFGEYSIVYGLNIKIYYLSSRLGVGLSIVQSKIVLSIILFLVGVILTAGVLFAVDFLSNSRFEFFGDKEIQQHYEYENVFNEKKIDKYGLEKKVSKAATIKSRAGRTKIYNNKNPDKIKGVLVNARLCINNIQVSDSETGIADDLTIKLYKKLLASKGQNQVVYRDVDGVGKSINRQLAGRLTRLGSKYIFSISIVDVNNGETLIDTAIKYKGSDDVDSKIDELVERIINKNSVWIIPEQK